MRFEKVFIAFQTPIRLFKVSLFYRSRYGNKNQVCFMKGGSRPRWAVTRSREYSIFVGNECYWATALCILYHDGISSLKKATVKCIFMQLLLGNHHESSISDATFGGCFGLCRRRRSCSFDSRMLWTLCQNLSSKHYVNNLKVCKSLQDFLIGFQIDFSKKFFYN